MSNHFFSDWESLLCVTCNQPKQKLPPSSWDVACLPSLVTVYCFFQMSNLTGKITGRQDFNSYNIWKNTPYSVSVCIRERTKDCLARRIFRFTAVVLPDCYGLPWHGISSLLKTSAASHSGDTWTFSRNKHTHCACNCKLTKTAGNSLGQKSRRAEHFIWAW